MDNRRIYEALLEHIRLPRMALLEDLREIPELADPGEAAYRAVRDCPACARLKGGETVALTAGSREIYAAEHILRGVIRALEEQGAKPFIVTAMGSHGGATAEGQRKVLEHYGITPERMGVPVRAGMETVEIAVTDRGERVHLDRIAASADYIVPVGRIKPHTDFRGPVESGVMKMLVIGLGNQYGAALCHKLGFPRMGDSIWRFGNAILANARVLLGVGVVENAAHHTAWIEAMPAGDIPRREPELLERARTLMPRIPFGDLDVLLVSEMGKDISGAGMDPNVTGRSCAIGEFWPNAEKIGVFALTDVSEGNAAGVGNGDAITRALYEQIDPLPMNINSITCRDTQGMRIPAILETEELVLKYLLHTCIRRDATVAPRVAWIRNTASLKRLYVSEAMLERDGIPEGYKLKHGPSELWVAADGTLCAEGETHENFE